MHHELDFPDWIYEQVQFLGLCENSVHLGTPDSQLCLLNLGNLLDSTWDSLSILGPKTPLTNNLRQL